MKNKDAGERAAILRALPSVDRLLQTARARNLLPDAGASRLTNQARAALDSLRLELLEKISAGETIDYSPEELLDESEKRLENIRRAEQSASLRRVVNATGVVIHTNLGRAPLSEKARLAIDEKAAGYCTLEYNLETGKRGKRGARVEQLLTELTGAESALVVNNCAAAAFLVLTVLAKGGEVVVSRGELVEIGGDFRVPDVLEQSGAVLKEVGTTNRTKINDYERAINENTRLILRVHPSNYRIVGFTSAPKLNELAELAHKNELPLYEDAGSGALFDLSRYGLTDEPVISDSIKAGADVVTFSGDKLLGGVQSGLIVGRFDIIERIGKHPLYRALRVDKLAYAALEATLESFDNEQESEEIPVLKMLSMTGEELKRRAENFAYKLQSSLSENSDLRFEIIEGNSVVGGGSAPNVERATTLLTLKHAKMSAAKLEERLRFSKPPVIARITENQVALDLRTVSEREETQLLEVLETLGRTPI